jgi:peptidoglycan/LPS O-acetylase OafA/YrhL
VVAFVIGMAPHFLLHKRLDPVAPWYLGLFALGMAGALVSFSPQPAWRRLQADLPWAWFAGTLTVILVIGFLLKPAWLPAYPYYITEPLVGIAAVCGLIHYTRLIVTETGAGSPLLRLLESRWLVRMGLFSYSIYLMHSPLLDAPVNLLRGSAWSPYAKFLALWLLVLPLVLVGCYLFHLVFELPFMPRRSDQRILHSQREPAP